MPVQKFEATPTLGVLTELNLNFIILELTCDLVEVSGLASKLFEDCFAQSGMRTEIPASAVMDVP